MNPPFEIRCVQGDYLTWTDHFDKHPSGLYLPAGDRFSAYGGWGDMLFQNVKKKHYSIWYNRYNNNLRRSFKAIADSKLLEFSLQMDNTASYNANPLGHQTVKNSQFNVFFLPDMDSQASFEAGQLIATMDIHFTFEFLKSLVEPFPDILIPFLDNVTSGNAVQIFKQPLFATNFMLSLSEEILQILKTSPDNDYMLDLTVKNLLCCALTCKYELDSKKQKIKLEQISNIHMIRRRLLTDFNQTPRLEDLAKDVHMSLPRFKVLFKEIVEEAPYRFWMNNRLKLARQRLLSTDATISDIAFDLEFPDVATFSKAFKNRYGTSPSELRPKK